MPSAGILLEMHTLRSHPRPLESESALEQHLQDILMHIRFTEALIDCIYYIDSLSS